MATRLHHAIVVTSWDSVAIRAAAKIALNCGLRISSICETGANGFASFLVPPDGHGEEYPRSQDFDDRRDRFKSYLRAVSALDWFEASYAREAGGTRVTDDGCKGSARNIAALKWRDRE